MKKLIIPNFSESRIATPTKQDYFNLGMPLPTSLPVLDLPSMDEVKKYAGVDLSFGVPIVKEGFFGSKPSILYAPSKEDSEKLGIRSDFVIYQNGDFARSSYSIRDGVAHVQDPHGSLIETFARCLNVEAKVLRNGALNIRFLMPGMPVSGLGLVNPQVEELRQTNGSRVASARFPVYEAVKGSIPEPVLQGTTSNGLEYALY